VISGKWRENEGPRENLAGRFISRFFVGFREAAALRCQTSINCLNANEAGHCTDTARTKGHKDVIPSEARDVARAVRALLLLSEKQALSIGLDEQERACNARDSK